MKPLTVDNLVEATGGRIVRGDGTQVFGGVCSDSRSPVRDSLFVAIRGESFDGHRYVADALTGGCAGALVEDESTASGSGFVVQVDDTVEAMGRLAAWWRNRFAARVVGVTGSNGKSTTKEMLGHVLRRLGRRVVVPQKSFNNNIGVPLTLFAVDDQTETVVVEMGTNAPGEIAALAGIVRPDVAIITNVGPCHLEKLGSLEGVAREKSAVFEHLAPGGTAVVNLDDPRLRDLHESLSGAVLGFGRDERAEVCIYKEEPTAGGTRVELADGVGFELSVPGPHNVSNAVGVLAVCRALGEDVSAAADALEDFTGLAMRLERIACGHEVTVINDAYNANPQSVAAALSELVARAEARTVAVLGDMLELGDLSPRFHREVGRRVAELGVTVLVTVGERAREMVHGAVEAGMSDDSVRAIDSTDAALEIVPETIRPGDTVLVKASRGMALERLVEALVARFGRAAHDNQTVGTEVDHSKTKTR